MAITRISKGFKDISLSFDMHPVTKDILVLTNEIAIKKSIKNIIQTIPSERFFNPLFGSEIKPTLFEFIDFGTASILQTYVEVAISNFEPRVENVKVEVTPYPDLNSFEIVVYFTIIGENTPKQTFTYILEAIR
jgi:phage baseplate assembly protein W